MLYQTTRNKKKQHLTIISIFTHPNNRTAFNAISEANKIIDNANPLCFSGMAIAVRKAEEQMDYAYSYTPKNIKETLAVGYGFDVTEAYHRVFIASNPP